ncbi:hypothetical protein LCGC14_0102550 [marine sediment metagenome]|uniref:Rod shape-determining protein MreD n=1 Tax=marine sediment metagenome TaxID=412755 RepID=A0A0F9VFK1_9ZZZZ|nr:rod shape-determining protein MreD [Candidatus Nealsonbacteria bacterium]
MKKFLFLILILYVISLAQTSFFVPFSISGELPNLILIFVIFFVLLEDPKENLGFFVSLFGGLFIDIFSSHLLGTTTILLLITAFLLKKLSYSLKKMTFFWFSLLSLAALIFYKLFLDFILYFIQEPALKIDYFRISPGTLLSVELIYSFVLLLVGFHLIDFFKKYVRFLSKKT